MSDLAAISVKLDELQRAIARIEPAQQRNYDNVDQTRHSLNNSLQKVAGDLDNIEEGLRDIIRELRPIVKMAEDAKGLQQKAQGGLLVSSWIWPLLSAVLAVALGYKTLGG